MRFDLFTGPLQIENVSLPLYTSAVLTHYIITNNHFHTKNFGYNEYPLMEASVFSLYRAQE